MKYNEVNLTIDFGQVSAWRYTYIVHKANGGNNTPHHNVAEQQKQGSVENKNWNIFLNIDKKKLYIWYSMVLIWNAQSRTRRTDKPTVKNHNKIKTIKLRCSE